jgi:hypothetical protein
MSRNQVVVIQCIPMLADVWAMEFFLHGYLGYYNFNPSQMQNIIKFIPNYFLGTYYF